PAALTATAVTFDLPEDTLKLPYSAVRLVLAAQLLEGDPFEPYSWNTVPLLHDGHHGGRLIPAMPRFAPTIEGEAAIVWSNALGVLQSIPLAGLSDTFDEINSAVAAAQSVI